MKYDQFTPAPVEVTQADREAAADLIDQYFRGNPVMQTLAQSYRNGHSQGVWATAFARHRIAHSAPAGEVEPVAWMYNTYDRVDGHIVTLTWKRMSAKERDGGGWTEEALCKCSAHPAPPADLVELVGHWRFLDQMIEDRIVETDQPDRVMWRGVWYDGPLATAYLETLRAIQKLARAALAKHGGA